MQNVFISTKHSDITSEDIPTSHPYPLRTPINKGIVRGVTSGKRSHPMWHPRHTLPDNISTFSSDFYASFATFSNDFSVISTKYSDRTAENECHNCYRYFPDNIKRCENQRFIFAVSKK